MLHVKRDLVFIQTPIPNLHKLLTQQQHKGPIESAAQAEVT